jgi:EpsI family protein
VAGARPRLVWYWYDVAGRTTISPSRAKLAEALTLLRQGRSAQRVIVLSTVAEPSTEAAPRLAAFMTAHGDQLIAVQP